jgi:hypothetical protein
MLPPTAERLSPVAGPLSDSSSIAVRACGSSAWYQLSKETPSTALRPFNVDALHCPSRYGQSSLGSYLAASTTQPSRVYWQAESLTLRCLRCFCLEQSARAIARTIELE